jgi:hypothetical protein
MMRFCVPDTQSETSLFIFRTTRNLHPTASACKVQSVFDVACFRGPPKALVLPLLRIPGSEATLSQAGSSRRVNTMYVFIMV